VLGMRLQFVFACLFALLSAANSSAQQSNPTQQVLPDAFASWHSSGCDANPQRPALSQEAGQREFRQCQFTSGKQSATIWAGRYRDPSGAYEVYTSLLRPTMQPSTVGRLTAVDDKGLLALVGDIVVGVDQPRNVSTKDLQELTSIVAARADKTPLPPIREYLPKEDLVNATQHYALGPVGLRAAAESVGKPEIAGLAGAAGFAQGAEAMLAQYRRGREAGDEVDQVHIVAADVGERVGILRGAPILKIGVAIVPLLHQAGRAEAKFAEITGSIFAPGY